MEANINYQWRKEQQQSKAVEKQNMPKVTCNGTGDKVITRGSKDISWRSRFRLLMAKIPRHDFARKCALTSNGVRSVAQQSFVTWFIVVCAYVWWSPVKSEGGREMKLDKLSETKLWKYSMPEN